MKSILLYTGILLIFHATAFAQKDSLVVKKIKKNNVNYKAYVLANGNLFALNDSGKLVVWDLKTLDTVSFAHNNMPNNRYTAIAKDNNNIVFLGTRTGDIFRLDPITLSYSLFLKAKYTIRYICFNSSNKLFLIVHDAVYDPLTKRYWNQFENHSSGMKRLKRKRFFIFFHKTKKVTEYFAIPQYTFLDSDGRWWMTAVYGEFGGEVQVFDTEKKRIVDNKFGNIKTGNLSPRSVFEDGQKNIYITCGLQHFMNFGEIYKIDKNRRITKVLDSIPKRDTIRHRSFINNNNDFIGPGAYNKSDNYLYFATTSGFYKAALTGDKLKPEFLCNPILSWSREPKAIGIAMSILKLDFTADNKLLFLTENDGFGIYDGKALVLLK